MSDEKRTFSRVPVRLKGHARVMHSIDSSPIFNGDAVGGSCSGDDLFRKSKLPEDLTRFLIEMDRKLDQMIGLMSQGHIRNDFPYDIEIMELSAAGVKFRTKDVFKADAPLEIVIVLSQIPLRMAGSKGRVLGIEQDTELYRFEFVDVRGSDMEAIVQFVFQQQREQIRNSRM